MGKKGYWHRHIDVYGRAGVRREKAAFELDVANSTTTVDDVGPGLVTSTKSFTG
ncbi:hypothetical protein AK830_g6753 [Neonectria ditissima]|uniref:Uncharacterized protein n=1 Tax=Neonectria ditissima TaxID=78410 RepID=A0A0P7BH57_9HYPO|nr:hypothetical protein AK830_g6753 [Neonectria ditissima]